MRALMLDYSNSRRRPRWPDILLLLGGLATAGYAGVSAMQIFSQLNSLEAKQAGLHRSLGRDRHSTPHDSPDAQQLRAEVKQANSVLGMLTLPWDNLFKDMESSNKERVALLAITPDPDKRTLKITAEAKDFNAMIAYIRFLQSRDSLTGVYLLSHHIEERSAEKPIRFVLAASWVLQP